MNRWKMVKIEDVCEILDHMRIPIKASERKSGPYPYYGANGIQDYVSDYIFNDELVLLAEDGGNFGSKIKPIAYRVSGKCWVNNHAHVLKPKPMLDVDFLCYSLMFYDVSKFISGTTRAKLNQSAVRKMVIPLPPLEIQRKIANTLDTVSEILAMRKQQLAELDNLIKSIFFDMFGDPVTNEKGWSIHKLGEVCDVRDGTHDSPNYVESGYPLVTSKNVRNGEISLDDVSYISYEDYCEINKRSKVDKGDIIMPMIGTIGNPAIVKHDAPSFAIKNVALIKFPIPSRIGNLYLKELLTLDFFTIITQKRSRGGTQKFIALGDIRNLEIPVPPINIQSGFENKVTIIESVKEKVTLALDEIQYLFDSIMSRYFY